MADLSGLQIFKYLPAAKKAEGANCKKCGFPTCMTYALKLAKGQADIALCGHAPEELKKIFEYNMIKPQKEISIGGVKIGGENVLYRHDKTFINKTAIAVVVDPEAADFEEKLRRIQEFSITRVNDTFKIDFVISKGAKTLELPDVPTITELEFENLPLLKIDEVTHAETLNRLIFARKKAVLEKDENYNSPTYVYFKHCEDLDVLCAKSAFYICKYANLLVFEDFDEAMISTLMTLRQNIFTDPQKPLKVEPKVYEFNNPQDDEGALIFLTTNFALTYFAVANELESLKTPSYLIVTPSDGMSVLTAWSAEKFTAQIFARAVKKSNLLDKVKVKQIIIPGLLAHMKDELQAAVEGFEIVVGTVDAYQIADFVANKTEN